MSASALETLVAAHWKPDELQAVLRHPKVKVRDEHSNPALFLSEFTAHLTNHQPWWIQMASPEARNSVVVLGNRRLAQITTSMPKVI